MLLYILNTATLIGMCVLVVILGVLLAATILGLMAMSDIIFGTRFVRKVQNFLFYYE